MSWTADSHPKCLNYLAPTNFDLVWAVRHWVILLDGFCDWLLFPQRTFVIFYYTLSALTETKQELEELNNEIRRHASSVQIQLKSKWHCQGQTSAVPPQWSVGFWCNCSCLLASRHTIHFLWLSVCCKYITCGVSVLLLFVSSQLPPVWLCPDS